MYVASAAKVTVISGFFLFRRGYISGKQHFQGLLRPVIDRIRAKLLGAPVGHTLHIRQVRLNAGAGFVVAFAGDIIAMPGLPKVPAAEAIDVDENGEIVGLF